MIVALGYLFFLVIPIYLLLWLLNGLRKTAQAHSQPTEEHSTISLIIPFRNEVTRIQPLLKSISALSLLPGDEIILVDDHSTDGGIPSGTILRDEVRLLSLGSEAGSKKAALQYGIEQAKNEWIVTTDADCWFGPELFNAWRKQCSASLNMGIGPVLTSGSGIIAVFHHEENRCLHTISLASAGASEPLLSSGANLLFRKSIWEQVGGYASHASIPSGDDVLLMRAFHQHNPTGIRAFANPAILVETVSSSNWKEWFLQRRRWASKTGHLSTASQRLHGVLLLVWLMLFPVGLFLIGPVYGLMLLPEMLLIQKVTRSTGGWFEWYFWPFFRMFYPVLLCCLPLSRFVWSSTWKTRSFAPSKVHVR